MVIEFIALVPKDWVKGSNVLWPPYKTDQRTRLVAYKNEPPADTWTSEVIKRILYKNG